MKTYTAVNHYGTNEIRFFDYQEAVNYTTDYGRCIGYTILIEK